MIYLASSWKNTERLDEVRNVLRGIGKEVYDFREDEAFHWSDVDPSIQRGSGIVTETDSADFQRYIQSETCQKGFSRDMKHLRTASKLVLILPCGKSAHLELGYAIGAGIETAIYLTRVIQPELMYLAADFITDDLSELMLWAA